MNDTVDKVRAELGFEIDPPDEEIRVLRWMSGGCRPANHEETAMWDLLQAGRASQESKLQQIRALIADDASAITYQSLGQYRAAMLKSIDAIAAQNNQGDMND